MKTTFLILMLLMSLCQVNNLQAQTAIPASRLYGTGTWNADSLGNHRVVMNVDKQSEIVLAHIPWRRRDFHPELKSILIIEASTGKLVQNLLPVTVNREFGDVLFQSSASGEYYFYFLKYKADGKSNYPKIKYPGFLQSASAEWLSKAESAKKNLKSVPLASIVQFQSVDDFNSFYPMELIATKDEVNTLVKKNGNAAYLTFTESRENQIKMTTDLPAKWIADGAGKGFSGKAKKGEYFTFQIGVYPVTGEMEDIKITFSPLINGGMGKIGSESFTCFNLGGIDWEGKTFVKKCPVGKGKVQPLWVGFQVPEDIAAGIYKGEVKLIPKNMPAKVIPLKMEIESAEIIASGDNDPGKMSRLRWLNSTLENNDETVAPYTPLTVNGNTIECLGREVTLNQFGLPESITSHFSESVTKILPQGRELLAAPVHFIVEQDKKISVWNKPTYHFTKKAEGAVAWDIENETSSLSLKGKGQMEFDGNIDYQFVLTAREDMKVSDIRLEVPFKPEATKYMMGLGQKGGFRPAELKWKWKVENNQDGPWIGDVNAGLQVRLRDNHYSRPLNTNFYLSKPLYMPDSWFNSANGGIDIISQGTDAVLLSSYSGERTIKKGEQLHFYFNFLITPFRTINTTKQWHDRYYHSYKPIDTIKSYGSNTINIHHANAINPYINYPFLRPQTMKSYIDSAHTEGLKVKIYYTVRELSNKSPELFMLRSLGDEVLSHGKGGGFSWLQEHLDSNYIAAWFVPDLKDAAIITSGISRWHNYYVEGMNWLVKNVGIDGIYIDDIAFDRTTMKRVRKILTKSNPESLIDVHSANQFNPRDGFANSANLYLEHFPFIDRLWFGEYFNYDFPPDFWLIETSGIPFGLMGEMLEKGGNPWRGMLFGMTARAPWSGDPASLWKFWDNFGIQHAEMIGFWDSASPIRSTNEKVKASVYLKKDEVLIAVANWNPGDSEVKLDLDIKKLGFTPKSLKAKGLAVDNFQPEIELDLNQPISIPGGKGYLLLIK